MIPIWSARNRCDDSYCDHVIESVFNLFTVLYGYLLLGMLYLQYGRASPDGVGPRHVTNGVKGVGECLLQCHYVPDLDGGARGIGALEQR